MRFFDSFKDQAIVATRHGAAYALGREANGRWA
jgi:hypothetical protein